MIKGTKVTVINSKEIKTVDLIEYDKGETSYGVKYFMLEDKIGTVGYLKGYAASEIKLVDESEAIVFDEAVKKITKELTDKLLKEVCGIFSITILVAVLIATKLNEHLHFFNSKQFGIFISVMFSGIILVLGYYVWYKLFRNEN